MQSELQTQIGVFKKFHRNFDVAQPVYTLLYVLLVKTRVKIILKACDLGKIHSTTIATFIQLIVTP